MIRIHDRMEKSQAAQILTRFQELCFNASRKYDCSVDVEPYENGREHGYYLQTWRKPRTTEAWAVAFSEHRMCDDIVVYFGKPDDFVREGHVPTQEVYVMSNDFKRGDIEGAAQFIFGYLIVNRNFRAWGVDL